MGEATDADEIDLEGHGSPGNGSTSLEDAVAELLSEAGEPTHISRIRELLIDGGVPIPGHGEDANVIVRITADGRFCALPAAPTH